MTGALAKLRVGAPSGRRNRSRRARNAGGGGVAAAYAGTNNRVSAGPSRPIGNGGRIRLQRDELLVQVNTVANKDEKVYTKSLVPGPAFMPFLHRLSECYQRIRWLRMHITWRPACGTNTNGIITYGVAYNNTTQFLTRGDVTALTPVNDHPVWQASGNRPLVIPGEMLMSRKWYGLNTTGADPFDKQVGTFVFGISHDVDPVARSRGEFWVNYSVEMEGTNPG